jgi:NADH:ubiquinone oxidoreductase subunit 2 (subunit N)
MNINFFNLFENDFLALFPEIFLVISTLLLLMYGVFLNTSKQYNYPILIQNVGWLSLLSIVFTLCLLCNNPIHQSLLFYNTLIIDDFTYFFKILLLSSSFCAILISFDLTRTAASLPPLALPSKPTNLLHAFEYMILILFSTASMLFMISSFDFISMYLTVELQSLCFYVLAASKRNSEFSTEAGLKYFILGAFSSGILLFGCSMIYGFTGITNFGELAKVLTGSQEVIVGSTFGTILPSGEAAEGLVLWSNQSSGIIIGIIFLAVGFLFKLTAAPFHMWAPDVYEGSPTGITAFFSIAPKIAILGVFLRLFLVSFYDLMLPWQKIIVFCSIASMIVGALAAMSQHKIKRLLAYSSIGHIGYILLGLSCATIEGIEALFIYLIIYVIMTINLFAIILSLRVAGQSSQRPQTSLWPASPLKSSNFMSEAPTHHLKYISDLGMLAKTNPILAFTLTCTLFSMAGIPPLAGFCSKFYIFFAALSSSLYLLAFIGVLTSVVSCFYYIRLIKIMYFEKPTQFISYQQMDKEKSILIGLTLFFMIFFFLYPSPLFLVAHKVAISLSL